MIRLGNGLRRSEAPLALVFLALVIVAAGLLVGCSKAESEPPRSAIGSVPTESEILAAAAKLSDVPSAKVSNPETIACPKAADQGWSAYEVQLTGGDGSRLFIRYQSGEWTRLNATAPCLACHPDNNASSQPSN